MNQEPDEDSEREIYEEFEEDPEEVTDEDPEEYDQDVEYVIYEEYEENLEQVVGKELEEDPELLLEEDSDEGLDQKPGKQEGVVKNSDPPSRNCSSNIKDLGHELHGVIMEKRGNKVVDASKSGVVSSFFSQSEWRCSNRLTGKVEDGILKENTFPKDDMQLENASKYGSAGLKACNSLENFSSEERKNLESDTFFARKIDVEMTSNGIVDGDRDSAQKESGSSRKRRHSRWDLRQEEETPDGNNRRRKTRWDNNDSQNLLFRTSGFLNSIEHSTDPNVLKLKNELVEVNKKLQCSEFSDEISAPRPDCENTQRKKLEKKRMKILTMLSGQNIKNSAKFVKKIFVPVEEYPTYNFVGLILGPRGDTQKKMEKETGAKILLRGIGSRAPDQNEKLHVLVEADNQLSLSAAVAMIEKLCIPVSDMNNVHKRAQLAELAKLKEACKYQNTCNLCKEQGHMEYACPLKDTTFRTSCCDFCGGFDHPSLNCRSKDRSNIGVDNATLYVGYLSHATDEKRLKELFLPFGKIVKTSVIKDPSTGLSKGYGFVQFDNPSDADAAVTYMHGHKMDGKILAVRIAGKKPVPGPLPTTVPSLISWQTSSTRRPVPYMCPDVNQAFGSSWDNMCIPHSSGNVAITMGPTIPSYGVSNAIKPRTRNDFSGGNFSGQIPSSLPETLSQFPGDPQYSRPASSLPETLSQSPGNPEYSRPASSLPETLSQFPGDPEYSRPASSSPDMSQFPGNPEYSRSASWLPVMVSQFPGNPDYSGFQSQSYFTSPIMNEFQTSQFSQETGNSQKPYFDPSFLFL